MKQLIFNEVKTDEKDEVIEHDEAYYRLKSAIPVLIEEDPENNQNCMMLLCENEKDEIIMMNTYFDMEYDYEAEYIRDIPIHTCSSFISQSIGFKLIRNHIPNYITDFKFDFNEDKLDSRVKEFTFNAYLYNNSNKETFIVNTQLLSCIRFYIEFLISNDFNYNSLYNVSLGGVNKRFDMSIIKEAPSIVMVKSINNLISMAKPHKKSNTLVVKFDCECSEIINGQEQTNDYTILSSFEIGNNINNKKCNKTTVEKMKENFRSEEDRYLMYFNYLLYFDRIDKEYIVIKALNKDEKFKLFFINKACQEKIIELINDK